MGTRENNVVAACMKVLDLYGIPYMRNNTGAHVVPAQGRQARRFIAFGCKGWPDLIGCLSNGRMLGVECKAPALPGLYRKRAGGKLSDDQKKVHRELIRAGALILTVTSSTEMLRDLQSEGFCQ